MTIEDENRTIAEAFVKGLSTADLDTVAEDAEIWVAGTTAMSGTSTKQQMQASLNSLGDFASGPFVVTATGWTVQGERVAIEADSFLPLKDGRTYQNKYHLLLVIKNRKIVLWKEYMDTDYVRSVFG